MWVTVPMPDRSKSPRMRETARGAARFQRHVLLLLDDASGGSAGLHGDQAELPGLSGQQPQTGRREAGGRERAAQGHQEQGLLAARRAIVVALGDRDGRELLATRAEVVAQTDADGFAVKYAGRTLGEVLYLKRQQAGRRPAGRPAKTASLTLP